MICLKQFSVRAQKEDEWRLYIHVQSASPYATSFHYSLPFTVDSSHRQSMLNTSLIYPCEFVRKIPYIDRVDCTLRGTFSFQCNKVEKYKSVLLLFETHISYHLKQLVILNKCKPINNVTSAWEKCCSK